MQVYVHSYAGYSGEETPREIEINGRRVRVAEVRERRRSPECSCFVLLGEDGRTYEVCYDGSSWELTG